MGFGRQVVELSTIARCTGTGATTIGSGFTKTCSSTVTHRFRDHRRVPSHSVAFRRGNLSGFGQNRGTPEMAAAVPGRYHAPPRPEPSLFVALPLAPLTVPNQAKRRKRPRFVVLLGPGE